MKKLVVILFSLVTFFGQAYAETKKVDLSTLAKYKFQEGELYADLIGVSGQLPLSSNIDFEKNLKSMWDKKNARKKGVTDVARATSVDVLKYYSTNKTYMTVDEYVLWINRDIETLKKNIDWVGVCGVRMRGLECELLKALSYGIYGRDLVAYGLTELMPSENGTLNVKLLDVLLRNAGRQYLDSVPALYDKYTSRSLWQFTQFAVYQANSELRGASSINVHVKAPYKIPGSVSMLRSADHHRAAYLFAVANLRDLVLRMTDAERINLKQKHRKHPDEIVQFIAIAHHLPSPAIKGARKWAANKMKTELRISLGPKLSKYANKTQGNLLALYKRT